MTGGLAVILGRTGINLGAGMPGGIAYVYKLSEARVNREALQSGEITISKLSSEDKDQLLAVLKEHLSETSSLLAAELIDNFDVESVNFSRVTPRDFARVLEIQTKARELGYEPDGDEVWTQILEVTNG